MSEAAGLLLGGISLATLLTTCVECLDYVTLERNHGRDFEVTLAQFSLLNCRLNVWGDVLRVQNEGREHPALRKKWPEIGEVVVKSLASIQDAFKDASILDKRYGLRKMISGTEITQDGSSELMGIVDAFGISQRRRQRETSLAKRAWWAVHDKKKADALLATINAHIESLEKLGEGLDILDKQKKRIKSSMEDVEDQKSIELLRKAEQAVDGYAASRSAGHLFLKTSIGERAMVTMGDADTSGGFAHQYVQTRVGPKADVHMGNLSGTAAVAFWGAQRDSRS